MQDEKSAGREALPAHLRRSVVWGSVGAGVLGLAQWVLVVVLARVGGEEVVGQFTFALAITAPIFLFTNMNLQVVQASDTEGSWAFETYLSLRVAMSTFAFLAVFGVAVVRGLDRALVLVVGFVAIAKFVETLSNNYYGLLQRNRRLDVVGKSRVLRGIFGSTAAVTLYLVTGQVVFAGVGLTIGWFLVFVLFDRSKTRHLIEEQDGQPSGTWFSLLRRSFPLGVDSAVNSTAINAPRYAVEFYLGIGALGVFSTIAFLSQMTLIATGAAGNAFLPDLADLHAGQNHAGFRKIVRVIWAISGTAMVVGPLLAWFVGAPLVGLLLGPAFDDRALLTILMFAIGLVTLHRLQTRGLQSAGRFGTVLRCNIVLLLATIVASLILVPRFDLIGAAWSMTIGFAAAAAASFVSLTRVMSGLRPHQSVEVSTGGAR